MVLDGIDMAQVEGLVAGVCEHSGVPLLSTKSKEFLDWLGSC